MSDILKNIVIFLKLFKKESIDVFFHRCQIAMLLHLQEKHDPRLLPILNVGLQTAS